MPVKPHFREIVSQKSKIFCNDEEYFMIERITVSSKLAMGIEFDKQPY